MSLTKKWERSLEESTSAGSDTSVMTGTDRFIYVKLISAVHNSLDYRDVGEAIRLLDAGQFHIRRVCVCCLVPLGGE